MRFCAKTVAAAMLVVLTISISLTCDAQDVISGTEYASVEAIPPAPDGEARTYYDAATGKIYLTIGSDVLIVHWQGLPFNSQNRNIDTPLGEFEQCDCSGIVQLSFSGLAVGGPYDMGNMLPADLSIRTAAQFAAKYPDASFSSSASGMFPLFSQFNVIPVAIPEPASGVIWLMTVCACASRRRKVF